MKSVYTQREPVLVQALFTSGSAKSYQKVSFDFLILTWGLATSG
jgi:hypothetical protein